MKVQFSITHADIAAYQYAVRDRVRAQGSSGSYRVQFAYAAIAVLLIALMIFGDKALLRLTGQPTNPWTLVIGLVIGAALTFAIYWINYLGMRAHLVRSDGPTLAEHVVEASDDAFLVQGRHSDTSYRWSAFEAVSEYGNLFILWIEPALGLIVPRSAFADTEAASAFFEFVKERIKTAGRRLPNEPGTRMSN